MLRRESGSNARLEHTAVSKAILLASGGDCRKRPAATVPRLAPHFSATCLRGSSACLEAAARAPPLRHPELEQKRGVSDETFANVWAWATVQCESHARSARWWFVCWQAAATISGDCTSGSGSELASGRREPRRVAAASRPSEPPPGGRSPAARCSLKELVQDLDNKKPASVSVAGFHYLARCWW